MEGFEKINLDSPYRRDSSKSVVSRSLSSTPQVNTSNRFLFFKNKNTLIVLAVILILVIISSFAVVLPAQKVYKSARKTYNQTKVTVDALKKQNVALASEELKKTRQDLSNTQSDLNSLRYLRFVPIANLYYNDAQHLVKSGFYGLDAASVLIESVKPYADVLGLKGQGSFVMGSAEQRIQTAITTMSKVTPRIDEIEKYLSLVKKEMDEVDPNRYPPIFGLGKIRNNLINIKKITDDGVSFISQAKPLIKVLPDLLGAGGEKKYLVLFQNDKELRPTGGFITAYSIFRIDKGVIYVDKSDNIYNLDNTIPNKPRAPEPILKYLKNVSVFNLRDSNLSPDFIDSMKTFNSLYDKAGGKVKIDGIITIDTYVLVSTIKILDDRVDAAGMTFTTKKDPRCDCPQVIYQLESSISTPLSLDLRVSDLEAIQARRKDIIGDLLYAILNKALKSSPRAYWGPLFQDFIAKIAEKHVLFDLYDKAAQQGIDAVNADGRIRPFDGDYLNINEANFGGQKSNLYISRTVTQNYQLENDGNIIKTLTINYKNPYPASDCNLERGGLCLNAVYRNWFRIYVPKGSRLISSQGSEVNIKSYEDFGKTVFEGFLTVRPEGAATFTISYRMPEKFAKNSTIPLLIQKQPGTDGDEYAIKVNDREQRKLKLLTDKELQVNLK